MSNHSELRKLDIDQDLTTLVEKEFFGLHSGGGRSSIKGGQSAADKALNELDVSGYAKMRSEILPLEARGASVLSPYIRHNILGLQQVWDHVQRAPYADREKFRDELLWQEYARHLYARLGVRLFENLRFQQIWDEPGDGWNREMACIEFATDELYEDGWLVNQSRMWLASHWSVRNERGWLHGQEEMYRHLIDGSRAANLLGWQWTVGSGTGKPYGFARWQVEKRAPGLCMSCPLKKGCPIQEFPIEVSLESLPTEDLLVTDPDINATSGPLHVQKTRSPEAVLLTIDSLGDKDPALQANPELPVLFIFNSEALKRLQLSSKRIFFYLETLQDLAERRSLIVYLGNPYHYAIDHPVAVTYAPVPSFHKFANLAEIHPYPWLRRPHAKSVRTFSAWRNHI
jgi:deoxyribodipyrimidine photo-lyase